MNTIRAFFPKSGRFFRYSKKRKGDHPLALVARLNPMSEHVTVCWGFSRHPIKLFNPFQVNVSIPPKKIKQSETFSCFQVVKKW